MFLAAALPVRAADTVTADDTARFLAGMPPSADSPLTPLTKDPSWQRHAKFFDTAFGQLEQRQLSKIRAWADANLAAPRPTMFYMFSGPDFLYADAFYSKATTYVLSALEPVGSVPDLTQIAARRRRRRALRCRALAELDPELQLLHHQADEDRSARRASSTAPCRSSMFSWRARERPSATSAWSRSTTRAPCIPPTKMPARTPRAASGSCSPAATAWKRRCIISRTDLSNSGVKSSGFLKFCDDAGARQQPDQERVLSAAFRQFHHRARLPARQQRHHHPGRFRHSAGAITIRRNGGSFRSAAMPARSANSPEGIRSNMPSCSGAASRSISASAIAGARMNRTCCCRCRLPSDDPGQSTRRRRPSRCRRSRRAPSGRVRRRRSSPSEEASSGFANSGAMRLRSPVHALARHDEGRGARRFGVAVEKSEAATMMMSEREDGDQIDLSGIVDRDG